MHEMIQPIAIATGATTLYFVVNPYVFYGSLLLTMFTCMLVCWNIIRSCNERNKRIDALKTRATRRANAKLTAGNNERR